ncbi:dihydroxyacetone kinase subunit DhaL [Sulfitobacter sp. D35]|uniref:dihydroxyacetone kinase subunit DhaL n=1 Tax=Sulfitobacter sp. D35 TaxID=3083252 RepID=UPI00296EF712|nr:dihydroxyacetone kinase subunit DhaL [Sulfitobacter sp. D35]MDW4497382.1 dihydroxyacetone kinase subunit DhaL [Sulfitobacter sp. D35]
MAETQRKLINDPEALIEELIAGMVSAHPHLLTVEGETGRAIVARNGPRDGKVGIVVGGGSGHEPAFAGYVGRGLADAAPLGNIFASPSPTQIMDAGRAADGGAGVLFLYGNYTGDVMNFGMAEEGLGTEGITARSFVVTDDIASAPLEKSEERRGIAGDFFVFKVAGAAADLGLSLEAVEAAAKRANDATRTMGVALSPCSMPQTGKANFDIPVGEMEIGMGIHGEPGVERIAAESADAVTDRLLAPILEELALAAGDKVAVLVNGLGSTTLLELYLLHRRLAETLAEREVEIHHSWVGEYCTSLEMGGASITLMKLDPELQRWLDHPCETPALRVGASDVASAGPRTHRATAGTQTAVSADRSALMTDGALTPAIFRTMLEAAAEAIFAERDRLSELDGAIGDGDHGVTMEIGWKAVLGALDNTDAQTPPAETCRTVAQAFLDAVGASAGPLYASAFSAAGDAVAGRLNLDAGATVAWLDGMSAGIMHRGGAVPGDKTMVDAWGPAVQAAKARLSDGGTITECLEAAAEGAADGAEATRDMESRRGRSKKLGARSVGHVDAGAESAAVMIRAFAAAAREAGL